MRKYKITKENGNLNVCRITGCSEKIHSFPFCKKDLIKHLESLKEKVYNNEYTSLRTTQEWNKIIKGIQASYDSQIRFWIEVSNNQLKEIKKQKEKVGKLQDKYRKLQDNFDSIYIDKYDEGHIRKIKCKTNGCDILINDNYEKCSGCYSNFIDDLLFDKTELQAKIKYLKDENSKLK